MSAEHEDKNRQLLQPDVTDVLQLIREAAVIVHPNGMIAGWNPSAEKTYGYTADEIVGHPVTQLFFSENADQWPEIVHQVRRGETIEDLETFGLSKTGRSIEVSLRLSPIRNSRGSVAAVLCLAMDISAGSRLECAERNEFFLSTIISSAEDAIISKNMQGIVTSWNPGAERIFGYTAEEMIGKPIVTLIPPDHLDEEPQILERIRRGERIDHFEAKRMRKDGRIIDVALTISPIRDRLGQVVGASKIARDITQRRRWQKAEVDQSFLGALVESADDAIIGKDLDGIITSWNPAAEKLYGYTVAEMIGKPVALLIPDDHADEEPRILERIRRGEKIRHYETRRVRKDGRVIDVSLTVSPIYDSLGRIIGASKIARDISDRKHLEARERQVLRDAQSARHQAELAWQQAEQANKAKDEFIATVSHELRTPMTAIMGWTRMLIAGQLGPDRLPQAFQVIDRNVQSLAQLIEDLLDISRIISGQLRVEFKTVDLSAVVRAAVEAVRPTAEAKRIRIESVFTASLGPIMGDSERLQQVVWNLLSNAIKFTSHEGFVRIEVNRVGSQAELRVTDNGVGIKAEFLPYVFDRFTQADASITRRRGGLGMGLAIVKSLVELHGGTVSVASEGEGQGTSFTVKLPISALREIAPRQNAVEKASLRADLKLHHVLVGLKLLIVDDEPDTLELLKFMFNECGAIIQTAQSADEAMEIFESFQPDILVSDIGMPTVDGYELIRRIRHEKHRRIPAVALTALARIEDRVRALTAGYQMHVSKPVQPVELITIVSSLVGLVERKPGA